jgi:hypothetical protein
VLAGELLALAHLVSAALAAPVGRLMAPQFTHGAPVSRAALGRGPNLLALIYSGLHHAQKGRCRPPAGPAEQ